MRCPTCQSSNRSGAKFCNECGHRFASTESDPVAELKIVTVLFSDVSGFTSLSETLAPDALRDVMDGWFDRLSAIIERHGGTIDKFIGDAVMALFGAPVAREDDPKRAIDAALEMQIALREYNETIADRIERPLAIRIGINTGRVYAGMIGSGDNRAYTVMGDAVNIASRLESECPVGSIVISQSTQQHVRGLYELGRLPPLHVKGKSEPLTAFEVRSGVTASVMASGDQFEMPSCAFVRRDELTTLSDLYQAVKDHGTPRMAIVAGEAGMGKGELLRYGIRELGRRGFAAVLSARCHESSGAPFQVLAEALSRAANVRARSDSRATERVAAYLRRLLRDDDAHATETVRVLLWVLGLPPGEIGRPRTIDDPRALRHSVARAAGAWIRGLSRRGVVAFRIDNVHYASEAMMSLLFELVSGEPLPLLVTVSVEERNVAAWERFPRSTVIQLGALDEAQAREVAGRLLERIEPKPARLIGDIVDRAGGNPGFMSETVRTLVEQGSIVEDADAGVWRLSKGHPERLPVPDTIGQLVQARVDRLDPLHKRALQFAAVAGDRVWAPMFEPLVDLDPDLDAERISGVLEDLAKSSILAVSEQRAPDGSRTYRFRPALARELVYDNTVARVRNAWHAALAAWWSERAENDGQASLAAAAAFERAGDDAKAGAMYRRAGDAAAAVYANADARAHYESAATAMSRAHTEDGTRSAVLESLGDVCVFEGDYATAANAYDEALELAGDVPVRIAHLLVERGRARARAGDRDAAVKSYNEAVFVLDRGGPSADADWLSARAAALYSLGWACYLDGQTAKAEAYYRDALDHSRRAGAALIEARVEEGLGAIARVRGDIDEAIAATRRALDLRVRAGNRALQATSHLNLGAILYVGGRYVAAREACGAALALHSETGNIEGIAIAGANLGAVEIELGDLDNAERHLQSSLSLGARTNAWYVPENYRYLAEVAVARGELDRANEQVSSGLDALGHAGPVEFRGNLLATLGVIQSRLGHTVEAKGSLLEAMQIHEAAANSFELAVATYRYATVLPTSDRVNQERYLSKALERFREVGNAAWVTRCERKLAELGARS